MTRQWLVAFALGLLTTAAAADDKAAKADQEKLQGSWSVVSITRDGKALPEEATKAMQLEIKGDKLTVTNKDRVRDFTFKLDPDKKPKAIDVDMGGTTGEGIYQLDGDNFKLAHGEAGSPRPTEFASKEGSRITLMVFKRAKP